MGCDPGEIYLPCIYFLPSDSYHLVFRSLCSFFMWPLPSTIITLFWFFFFLWMVLPYKVAANIVIHFDVFFLPPVAFVCYYHTIKHGYFWGWLADLCCITLQLLEPIHCILHKRMLLLSSLWKWIVLILIKNSFSIYYWSVLDFFSNKFSMSAAEHQHLFFPRQLELKMQKY